MKKLFCIMALSLFLLSCRKARTMECVDSIVFWGGDPAADGMGWYVSDMRWGPVRYYVDNLPGEFQADSTPVRACIYETNKKLNCFCQTPPPVHRIKSISRR